MGKTRGWHEEDRMDRNTGKGGASNIVVPKRAGVTGPYQNIPKSTDFGETEESLKQNDFYKDIAVIAYKLPAADKSLSDLGAVVTSSGGNFTLQQLTDGDLGNTNLLPRDSATGYGWIRFAFPQPQTIKAVTMVGGGNPGVFGMGADAKMAAGSRPATMVLITGSSVS